MALGSLVIRLTMDTATFDTDSGRAAKIAEKRAKEIDAAFRKAGAAIGLALGAGLVVATKALKSGIDHMDEMSKSAQKVGDSTENFSRLVYAGELADVSMEQLVATMGRLTKSQAAALDVGSEQAKMFEALGIEIADAEGKLRSSNDVLLDFADRFKALEGSPEAMAAGFALFGRSFQDMIPLLKDGSAGLREAAAESDALGKTISTEAGKAAEEFNDNLTRLQGVLQGVALEVASNLLPGMVDLSGGFVDVATRGEQVKEIAGDITSFFEGLGTAAHAVSSAFELVGTGIATVVAQGHAAVKLLTGDLQGAIALYQEASLGFDAELAEAQGGGRAKKAGGERFPVQFFAGDDLLAEDRRQAAAMLESRKQAERLRKLLGGGESAPKRGGGSGKKASSGSDRIREMPDFAKDAAEEARRAAEAVADAREQFDAWAAQLAGPMTEAAYNFSVEQEKLNELARVGEVDAEQLAAAQGTLREEYDKSVVAIKAQLEPAQGVLDAIREETMLLGMSAEAQEVYNNLKAAGVEANSAFGQSIIASTENLQAMREQTAFMDDLKEGLGDVFVGFIEGTEKGKAAFKSFADDLYAQALKIVANQAINALLKSFSTGGSYTGAAAGSAGEMGAFQNWFNSFGGARANGGPTTAGKAYLVGERGPELFMPHTSGTVVPSGPTMNMLGGSNGPIQQTFVVQGRLDRRSRQQLAQESGQAARRAMARNG